MPGPDQNLSPQSASPESSNVSPEVSVIWKPLHRLLKYNDGNPIDPVTVLCYDIAGTHLPFAAITKSKGNRLILWPPFDASKPTESADGHSVSIQHVTLELANDKTHFTHFDSNGSRVHENRGWKLASLEDGMKLWLIGAFHVPFLQRQLGGTEQNVRMPTTDSKRRTDEFKRYASAMKVVAIKTPTVRGDCLATVIHLLPDATSFRGPFKPAHFPIESFWQEWIDGWTENDKLEIARTQVNVGEVNLMLLTAAPLGRIKGECFIGGIRPNL